MRQASRRLAAVLLFCLPSAAAAFEFKSVPLPHGADVRKAVSSTAVIDRDGNELPLNFVTLARSGEAVGEGGGNVFGALYDSVGKPIPFYETGAGHAVSHKIDFTSILTFQDRLFALSHFEHGPGSLYLTELTQNPVDGALTAVSTRNVRETSSVGGLWYPCAGVVTAWGTHLGGEEFPTDARMHPAALAGKENYHHKYNVPAFRYFFDVDLSTPELRKQPKVDLAKLKDSYNPYRYGYVFEARLKGGTDRGEPEVELVKHYAMGRFSHEVAYVMLDERTVYMTDDESHGGGFFLFIADRPRDFTSGTLYAARFTHAEPDGELGAGAGRIDWISLGHSTPDDLSFIQKSLTMPYQPGLAFSKMFDVAEPNLKRECPATFQSTNMNGFGKGECLRVKSGFSDAVASRLETRRVAAMRGATIEFSKSEGLAYDPAGNRLFMSIAQIKGAMTNESASADGENDWRPAPASGSNAEHVRLNENVCGAVYALDVRKDGGMKSDYVVHNMYELVSGHEKGGLTFDALFGNRCDVNSIAGPDNLTFIPGYRTLIIAEDSDYHKNNAVWAFNVDTNTLKRIQTTPAGAEATSVYYHDDIFGRSYLVTAVQHPDLSNATNGETEAGKYDGTPASFGVFGPLPKPSPAP